jgi:hypothetical protein
MSIPILVVVGIILSSKGGIYIVKLILIVFGCIFKPVVDWYNVSAS